MIKQSFLDSLQGLSLPNAKAKVKMAGHKVWAVDDGTAIAFIAVPNTVVLWHKNGVITSTTAGDGLELDKDN
jgi:hypothetical protein